jgi:ABC-type nitrate/sulfonate/bicarbonate transport system substrate-binding protein
MRLGRIPRANDAGVTPANRETDVKGHRSNQGGASRRDLLLGLAGGVAAATLLPRGARAAGPKLGIVSFPGPSISSHSKVIIKKNGFDQKHGWELDWAIRPTSDAYYNDFVNGTYASIDFGGLNVFANLFNKGVPFKLVQATVRWPSPIVVRAKGPTTIAELKGKQVGLDRSSFVYAYTATVAKRAGFDIEKDTQFTNLGFFQAVPRFKRGEFDAVNLLFEHAIQLMNEAPGEYRILCDIGAEFAKAIGAQYAYQYQAIRTDWIEQNKGGVERVIATYRDAAEFFEKKPNEAAKLLATPREQGGAALDEVIGTTEYATGTKDGLKTVWTSQLASGLRGQIARELEVYKNVGLIEKVPGDGFLYAGA